MKFQFDRDECYAIRDALSEEWVRMNRHVKETKQDQDSFAARRVRVLRDLYDQFKDICARPNF